MGLLDNAKNLYLEGIEQGNYREAVYKYTNPPYRQHSTGVKSGQEGFIEFFDEFTKKKTDRKFEIINSFKDNDYAFLFVKQYLNGEPAWVTMDIFRGDVNEKLIEHWDIIEEYKSDKQTDGNHKINYNECSVALNKSFVQKNINKLNILLINCIAYSIHEYTAYSDIKVHQIIGAGNIVAALTELTYKGTVYSAIQVFKFENSMVSQYWDTLEVIPTQEDAKNSGKF